jgi:D-arabinan exo alpha-(1,3)/(1,5)-arabinofuranosidase (non-reducing end)
MGWSQYPAGNRRAIDDPRKARQEECMPIGRPRGRFRNAITLVALLAVGTPAGAVPVPGSARARARSAAQWAAFFPAAAQAQAGTGAGKGPIGWDIYRRLDRLPELTPGAATKQFSSFDRAGGNADGSGWSCLRQQDGCVIAEKLGAGEIESLWFTRDFGDVTRTGAIKVELDGVTVLDAPLLDVVEGRLGAPFVFPLVANADQSSGGVFIRVPMPYRTSMRVTTDANPRFYHVLYREFADAEGVPTFDPNDPAQDVIDLLREFGTRDPKPVQPQAETQTASFALAAGASATLAVTDGPGMITEIRLRIPQIVGRELESITDDGRGFGAGGFSEFTVAIDPANQGVRLTRRLDTRIGYQRADVLVDGVVAAQWIGLPATPGGRWADLTVDLPASATAGKSAITIRNVFVYSELDFNEFHYWVDSRVGGALVRTDAVDVGAEHAGDETAHQYRIQNPTYVATPRFTYPLAPADVQAEAARLADPDAVLRDARLRITFDGARTVDAPLGEFFGSGLGEYPVRSLLFAMETTPGGSCWSWWPMPYQRRATVEIYNGSTVPIAAGDASVTASHDSRWLAALGSGGGAGLFHATSSSGGTTPGRDWLFLDANGRGKFVGVSHTAQRDPSAPSMRGYLEGDERVYVDGSRTPQIHGTGTEDYYEAGWYYNRGTFNLPTSGHPAEETSEAGCGQQCDSAFRLMIGDAVAFGSALRFGIEHGPRNDEPAFYGSTAFSYEQPNATLKRTDALDVGDPASENAHAATGGWGAPWTLADTFEGDDDTVVQSDDGRCAIAPLEFTLAIDRRNAGVRLRRLADQAQTYQAVHVFVNGRDAGIWQEPLGNPYHRWIEDTFDLSAALTADARDLRIRLEPLPGAPAWQAARYEAFARVPPRTDNRAPAQVSGLAAVAGQSNTIGLTWKPAFDDGVVHYEVYGARASDVALGPTTLLGVTGETGFAHEDLGLGERWSYRVRPVDASGNPGAPSAAVSATTGDVLGIEAESLLPPVAAGAPLWVLSDCCGATWSGGAQVWFQAYAAGQAFTVRFAVPLDGTYDLSAIYSLAPDNGVLTLAVDGREIGTPFDGYGPYAFAVAPAVDYGSVALEAGTHTLTWSVTGRNTAASGYSAAIDALRLTLQH